MKNSKMDKLDLIDLKFGLNVRGCKKNIQTKFEVNVTFGIFQGPLILLILAEVSKNRQMVVIQRP